MGEPNIVNQPCGNLGLDVVKIDTCPVICTCSRCTHLKGYKCPPILVMQDLTLHIKNLELKGEAKMLSNYLFNFICEHEM